MVKEEEKIRICVLDLIPEGVSDMEALAVSDFIRVEVENIEYFEVIQKEDSLHRRGISAKEFVLLL